MILKKKKKRSETATNFEVWLHNSIKISGSKYITINYD